MEQARRVPSERVPMMESLKRVLAEDIIADIDMPPFNKSAVDGFACRAADIGFPDEGFSPVTLEIREIIPAGIVPEKTILSGLCSRIMTGAMVPDGADCIVMVEDTEVLEEK
ncbi:MAG: molybdopterin molybdenumtransferase MoeA, partial [Bacteroidota bacterium]